MIIFYGEGRLGNQIFQYRALNRAAKNGEAVLAIGLENLEGVFDIRGSPIYVLTRNYWIKRLFKYIVVPFLLRPLGRTLKLINYTHEPQTEGGRHRGNSVDMILRTGVFRRVTFADGGFYQNALDSSDIFPLPMLSLKPEVCSKAQDFLRRIGEKTFKPPAFVHVRRGDYRSHGSYGNDQIVLPGAFYRDAMKEIEKRLGPAHFVFVTDDPAWVEENFCDVADKTVAAFEPTTDFAIMAECQAGVLSNSTFSLAAALLMREPEVVIGPLYWFGFRSGEWHPPKIRFDHPKFTYLPVRF